MKVAPIRGADGGAHAPAAPDASVVPGGDREGRPPRSVRTLLVGLVAGVGVVLAALVAVAVVGTATTASAYRAAESLAAQRQTAANMLLNDLLAAESTSRGYRLTGRAGELARFRQAGRRVPADVEGLRRLLSGEAGLGPLTAQLARSADDWLEATRGRISRGDQEGGAAARARQRAQSVFVAQYANLLTRVEALRRDARARADRRRAEILGIVAAAALLALAAVAVGSRRLWRGVGGPIGLLNQGVQRVSEGRLTEPIPAAPGSVRELSDLTAGFNRMQGELRLRIAELRDSRARIVGAGDVERRRLERDLHDGAQQRLVALAVNLRLTSETLGPDGRAALEEAVTELQQALSELRELARGIHPAVLSDQGLRPALEALVGRTPLPVDLVRAPAERLPAAVEAAAYFVVAEALTNVVKHSGATRAAVDVHHDGATVVVEVRDDGVGGAAPAPGGGMLGLIDRVSALDGRLDVSSPVGQGTVLRAEIPCAS
jgi:signal transduction histidine kinase